MDYTKIIEVIVGLLVVVLPSYFAIRKQILQDKQEKPIVNAQAVEKIVTAASGLSDSMLEQMNLSMNLCKEQIQNIRNDLEELRNRSATDMEELRKNNKELLAQNLELIQMNTNLGKKIQELEITIDELKKQLIEKGLEPKFGRRKVDKKEE